MSQSDEEEERKMLNLMQCASLEMALNLALPVDKEKVAVRHRLLAGEEIDAHVHDDVDEHVIVIHGQFVITIDGKRYSRECSKLDGPALIAIKKGLEHSFKAITPTRYLVIRG